MRGSRRLLLPLVAVAVLLLASCSGDDGDSADDTTTTTADLAPAEFDVTSTDFDFELTADAITAGTVSVNQTNEGEEDHQVTLVRLADDQEAGALATELAGPEGDAAAAPESYAGGPNAIPPGESNSATVELEPGNYALICFIASPDGALHFEKGMVAEIEVTGGSGADPAPREATETIGMDDFSFDVPEGFAGQGTIEVRNNGRQAHELTLTNGQDTAGGLATIAPGAVGYIPLELEPGEYTLVCFVTDPETRQPHLALGMEAQVTVGPG